MSATSAADALPMAACASGDALPTPAGATADACAVAPSDGIATIPMASAVAGAADAAATQSVSPPPAGGSADTLPGQHAAGPSMPLGAEPGAAVTVAGPSSGSAPPATAAPATEAAPSRVGPAATGSDGGLGSLSADLDAPSLNGAGPQAPTTSTPALPAVGPNAAATHGEPPGAPATQAPPQPAPAPHAARAAQQLAARLAHASIGEVDSISVDLRPPELGRVEMRVTFRDGAVHVALAVARPETLAAFERDRAILLKEIEQAGINLAGGGLDLSQGSLPQPQPRHDPIRATAAGRSGAEDVAVERPVPRPRSDSLFDLFA